MQEDSNLEMGGKRLYPCTHAHSNDICGIQQSDFFLNEEFQDLLMPFSKGF